MDYVGPFTFNSVRCLIGGLVLLPCIFFFKRFGIGDGGWEEEKSVKGRRDLITGGILCGVFLACASSAQQVGLTYTTVGKAGVIPAIYIVIVPVLGIFKALTQTRGLGKRCSGCGRIVSALYDGFVCFKPGGRLGAGIRPAVCLSYYGD